MTTDIESTPKLSPKDFLKSRRPERFSDSVRKEVGKLDRSVLEYQLTTLNRRSLELAFENFSKQLCEKIICPNLLEQTGPVAGGDGKVDTQTFPVSEQTKVLWYVGVNENSEKDRWAFAVSTEENWKAKCRKDIRKIKTTNRDYKKAFFITNMFAKANQRSDLEDLLTEETGIDVRILDLSWIMDQIFTNGYEQLAIDTLSIDIDWRREVEVGANDYTKNHRLQEIEEDIRNEIDTSAILPHQLDWLLEVAILSKELEKPPIETQGLFDRAIAAAKKFGSSYHQFSAHYQYAWAAYWWFEDMILFQKQLHLCFGLAKVICQSGQWGDVVSLIGLYAAYSRSTTTKIFLDIEILVSETKEILHELSEKDERPSNALMSKVYIELLNLQAIENIDQAKEVFSSLLLIVKEGESLVGFSFNELYDLVTELDNVFGDLESYELLLDYFTEQVSHREGETKGALLFLKRGARRLDSNEPYQAIKLIGKSLGKLYKKEVKKDLYVALNILSEAYKKVGLLWASRANLLLAASIVTDDFWKSGDLLSAQVYIYIRLAKTELQLGRTNYALAWWNLACIVDANLEEAILIEKEHQGFDAFLSQCILNTGIDKLKTISTLPDLLDQYQLFVSRSMLLHALGHEDVVEKECEVEINQEHLEYLKMVRDIDLGVQIPELINCEDRYSSLKSSVMGIKIKVSFPFRSPLVELAETLLSVIESFFSTSIVDHVFVVESRLDIEITADDDDEIAISHELDSSSSILKMDILCSSFTPDMLNVAGQRMIQEWLQDFIIEVFANMLRPKNPEQTLERMLVEERALERAVSFSACFVSLQNIMGTDAVKDIKSLLRDAQLKRYELLRTEPWDKEFPKIKAVRKLLVDCPSGDGEPSEGLLNTEQLSHRDMQAQDLITIRLWDRTVWGGTGFTTYPDGTPGLILLFEHEQAAAVIFNDLENKIGKEDRLNRLKISIIRHIDKKSPAHYRICISENISIDTTAKVIQTISRYKTMTPSDSNNLDMFLAAYEKSKKYVLSYTANENEKNIFKYHLHVIDAWEVGPNDMESVVIDEDDDPIIPEGVKNPPIIETLKRKFKQ